MRLTNQDIKAIRDSVWYPFRIIGITIILIILLIFWYKLTFYIMDYKAYPEFMDWFGLQFISFGGILLIILVAYLGYGIYKNTGK